MIVQITAAAELDLERIGDFIARDNPARAASFVSEILERCFAPANAPNGFPLVPRYASGPASDVAPIART